MPEANNIAPTPISTESLFQTEMPELVKHIKERMRAHHRTTTDTFINHVSYLYNRLSTLGLTEENLLTFAGVGTPQTLLNTWVRLHKALSELGFSQEQTITLLQQSNYQFSALNRFTLCAPDLLYFNFTTEQLYRLFRKDPEELPAMTANYFCLMHALDNAVTPTMIYLTVMNLAGHEKIFRETNNRIQDCKFILNSPSPIKNRITFATIEQTERLKQALLLLYYIPYKLAEGALIKREHILHATLLNLKSIFQRNSHGPLLRTYRLDIERFQAFDFSLFKRPSPQPEQTSKHLKLMQ